VEGAIGGARATMKKIQLLGGGMGKVKAYKLLTATTAGLGTDATGKPHRWIILYYRALATYHRVCMDRSWHPTGIVPHQDKLW